MRRTVRDAAAVLATLVVCSRALAQDAPPASPPDSPPPQDTPAAEPAAAEPPPAEPAAESAASGLTARARLEWITAAGSVVPRDTAVNPGNANLLLPQSAASSELRPELRLEYAGQLDAVARPRLLVEIQKPQADGVWRPEKLDARSEWIDIYASWRYDDHLTVAYGLQNFQWGPAELASPSNRIFHETGFARDPLYIVRGKHLARVNLSFGKEWSAVVLAEVRSNGEPSFVAGEPFDPKAQAKLEWSAPSGRGLAAVTAGAGPRTRGWFGEYGSVSLTDGLSLYADAVHQLGSRALYPVLFMTSTSPDATTRYAFVHTEARSGLQTLALGGVRYTFKGGADVRLEYMFDQAGWTPAQLALASHAASSPQCTSFGGGLFCTPPSPETIAAWLDPGFEILGRQHAYVSLSLPDLPPQKKLLVQLRYLLSLEDGSGVAFATASFAATDTVVVFASVAGTHGDDHGALSRLAAASATAGVVVSW